MKTLLALLLAIVAIASVCPGADAPAKNVSPDEAEALIAGKPGVLILDVRTPEEFADGHIAGAKNVDFFADDFAKQVAALDAGKPVLIHCAAGNRSSQALAKITAMKKFAVIYHLKAGFSGWAAAKKPVAK